MARVPIPTPGSGEQLRPFSDAALVPADVSAGGRMIGSALSNTAQAVQGMADQQEEADKALDLAAVKRQDTEDAKWARDRLYMGDNAFFKLQGFNALNARKPLEAEIADRRSKARAGMTTDRQREMYDRASEQRFGPELEGIGRYSMTEAKAEEQRASTARITELSNDAVTFWGNPEKRATSFGNMESEIRNQGTTNGWAPEVTNAAVAKAKANTTARAIMGMLDRGEVEAGSAEIERQRGVLGEDPDTLSALEKAVYEPLLDRQAAGLAKDIMGMGEPSGVVDERAQSYGQVLPRMITITAGAESRNRERDARGNLITSSAGAQGKMQVMPTTNTDPGYGVVPAKDNSDAERSRVGRDYLAALMKHYGNDPRKAWAAYNWGPGNFDNAVAAARKSGGDWFALLPKETRDYVTGNMAALGGAPGDGPGVGATPRQWNAADLMAKVDGMKLSFDLDRKVRAYITQRVGTDEQLLDRQRRSAEEDAYRTVESKGDNFTGSKDLPVSVRSRLTPQQRLQFDAIGERNLSKDKEKTDWMFYGEVSDAFGKDPLGFGAKYTIPQLRAKLGDTEFARVLSWRQASLQTPGGKSDDQVTYSRITQVTDPVLLAAGITRPPEVKGVRDAAADQLYNRRVVQFRNSIASDVALWQKQNPGKMIPDEELTRLSDRELIKLYRRDPRGNEQPLGFMFENPSTQGTYFKIDTATLNAFKGRYKQRWGRDPTEAEINDFYRKEMRGLH